MHSYDRFMTKAALVSGAAMLITGFPYRWLGVLPLLGAAGALFTAYRDQAKTEEKAP